MELSMILTDERMDFRRKSEHFGLFVDKHLERKL